MSDVSMFLYFDHANFRYNDFLNTIIRIVGVN